MNVKPKNNKRSGDCSEEAADLVECASPPCYQRDVDPAYFGETVDKDSDAAAIAPEAGKKSEQPD